MILSSDGNTNYQGSKGKAINAHLRPQADDSRCLQRAGRQLLPIHAPSPLLRSWNLTVQRQINDSMVVDFGYVGSNQSHIYFVTDLNQVPRGQAVAQ